MDSNIKELISVTLLEGLKFIESIVKHLPTNVIKEKNSITQSFQDLIRVINESKSLEVTNCDSTPKPIQIKLRESEIDDCKLSSASLPPKTYPDYITLQENTKFCEDPSKINVPFTRVDVLVNNDLKGLYYCLIEKGTLLLNKNLAKQNSEYVISLETYKFRAENNLKIKFYHNELEISLIFSSKNDYDTWLEYFFRARESVYSYAFIHRNTAPCIPNISRLNIGSPELPPRQPLSPKLPPKPKCKRVKSVENVYTIVKPDFVDPSTLDCIDKSKQKYLIRMESEKHMYFVRDPLCAPKIDKPPNLNTTDTKLPMRKPLPIKQVKSLPNSRRAHVLHLDDPNTLSSLNKDTSFPYPSRYGKENKVKNF